MSEVTPPVESEGGPNELVLSQRQRQVIDGIEALSNQYQEHFRNLQGTLVSNDRGYARLGRTAAKLYGDNSGGAGIVIGAGGLPSLLADLQIEVAINIDRNSANLDFKKALCKLILKSASAKEVFQALNEDFSAPILNQLWVDNYLQDVACSLQDEAYQYGPYHWCHEDRFAKVKQALGRIPMVYLHGDITQPGIGEQVGTILQGSAMDVSFVNATNIHQYLSFFELNSFFYHLPIRDDSPFLFSSHRNLPPDRGGYPLLEVVTDIEQYYELVEPEAGKIR